MNIHNAMSGLQSNPHIDQGNLEKTMNRKGVLALVVLRCVLFWVDYLHFTILFATAVIG